MTRLAIYLQDAHTISEAIEFARYAEQRGFEAVWQADSRLVRDAVVPMAAFAACTDTIKIGSGVVDCWTRNPARLASTFSTLDDLAPGRILLGIGAWWDPLAAKVGIRSSADPRPVTVRGWTLPGHQKMAGTRIPPSQVVPLPSRNRPADPLCVSMVSHGPLSEVNTTNVLSSIWSCFKAETISPTLQSISSMTSP